MYITEEKSYPFFLESFILMQQGGKRSCVLFSISASYRSYTQIHITAIYYCLLPQFKDIQVRLTGDSELPLGVNVNGCVGSFIEWHEWL